MSPAVITSINTILTFIKWYLQALQLLLVTWVSQYTVRMRWESPFVVDVNTLLVLFCGPICLFRYLKNYCVSLCLKAYFLNSKPQVVPNRRIHLWPGLPFPMQNPAYIYMYIYYTIYIHVHIIYKIYNIISQFFLSTFCLAWISKLKKKNNQPNKKCENIVFLHGL